MLSATPVICPALLPSEETHAKIALPTVTEEPNAEERRKSISAAKVQIGRSGRIVGQSAIQLHGVAPFEIVVVGSPQDKR